MAECGPTAPMSIASLVNLGSIEHVKQTAYTSVFKGFYTIANVVKCH